MKKHCLLSVVLTMVTISLLAQQVKFSPAMPEPGRTVKFTYDPMGGNLAHLANVSCEVKTIFSRDSRISVAVELTKVGALYEGTFIPRDSTSLAVFVFSADGNMDENPSGYYTKFYHNGNVLPMSLFLEGYLYASLGSPLAKIKVDHPKALALYQQAFDRDSVLGKRYLNNYLLTQFTVDPAKGKRIVYEKIKCYNKLDPSELNADKIAKFYKIIKEDSAADSVYKLIKSTYPKGAHALAAAIADLRNIQEADKKEVRFLKIVKDFRLRLDHPQDLTKLNMGIFSLAEAFFVIGNNEKVTYYLDKAEGKLTRAIVYHKYAGKNAAAGINLESALGMSKKAIALIDTLRTQEMPSYYSSTNEYLAQLTAYYETHNTTYVRLLNLLERNVEALAVAETAVQRQDFGNPEMNALYVTLLAKNGKSEEVVKVATRLIMANQDTPQMRQQLKAAYRGSIPFDAFYARMVNDAHLQQREKFFKLMINVPAPQFSLMNLKGERVELAKLKGKVVIVDYWATWCGPCILSFPGMQMAVDKYKKDPTVVFLFINTWQREEQREYSVKQWMATNPKYTFNVLLDNKSTDGLGNFEMVEKYKVTGIPTKFVIDGNGNIKFKTTGFDGTAEMIVNELDLMIEIAKGK